MKFINFAVVKLSLFLVLGILASHYFLISVSIFPLLLVLFVLVIFFWFLDRNHLFPRVFFGIATYLCFFSIGYFSYQMRLPKFQPTHFSHLMMEDRADLLQLKITQILKPDKFNYKYFAEVMALNGYAATGKILLNISAEPESETITPDKILLVYTSLSEIPKPLNPYQFDYSKYMASLGVHGQVRISIHEIIDTKKGSHTILGTAQQLRASIVAKLKKTNLKIDERAIIQALVLGEKKDIDKNLYAEYAAAGAVHILAVSGLHVGILYVILAFLFKPLARGRYGIIFYTLIIVLLLWGFALLSGLSPSVTRAVTMFSFFAGAKLLYRETNSLNTLFLSFLALLIINPFWLFQIGFQLSYLAVFFIVWLLPIFNKIGYSRYLIVRKLWSIVAVTICAQIGVLPLTLYYFHQFPGLFLVTNIVVLPFLTVLMFGGILVVILATFEILPDGLASSYNFLIETLNGFIHWIAVQDEFLFKNISFSPLKVITAYVLILVMALYLKNMNNKRLVLSLLVISTFVSIFIYEEYTTSSNHLIVFQKSKQTLVGYKNGKHLSIFKKGFIENAADNYPVKSYISSVNVASYSESELPNLFRYNHSNILVLDSLGVFPKQTKIHTLLLTNSPKLNLDRLLDSLKPTRVIADGSNYHTYVARWEKTCQTKKLPFSHTAKQGAFLLE
ncbi:ComEC/Rec2 family competence protein [Aequorivita sp. SDUM287046]|uniref:ComEC/Rec2 family competence protein n=1 Tax=Aequorivita aurantiaca TaxID=3053356 RepID=A0ABT8DFY6_9FLAO|nr:ComEC/Rec2 family competence protein [Aequorivita aurantiaca]MDN3724271.1 ComEC/Rec2 family competence protein [Aequorivita aurantiaca]